MFYGALAILSEAAEQTKSTTIYCSFCTHNPHTATAYMKRYKGEHTHRHTDVQTHIHTRLSTSMNCVVKQRGTCECSGVAVKVVRAVVVAVKVIEVVVVVLCKL